MSYHHVHDGVLTLPFGFPVLVKLVSHIFHNFFAFNVTRGALSDTRIDDHNARASSSKF